MGAGHHAILSARAAWRRHGQVEPNALLAEATGWRFVNELKRGLKA
jgi:hypothetical protein